MAYRLSPPTLDIILAPVAEKEKQARQGGKERRKHADAETVRQRHKGGRERESEGERQTHE